MNWQKGGCGAKTDELLKQTEVVEMKEVLDIPNGAFHLAFTKFSEN